MIIHSVQVLFQSFASLSFSPNRPTPLRNKSPSCGCRGKKVNDEDRNKISKNNDDLMKKNHLDQDPQVIQDQLINVIFFLLWNPPTSHENHPLQMFFPMMGFLLTFNMCKCIVHKNWSCLTLTFRLWLLMGWWALEFFEHLGNWWGCTRRILPIFRTKCRDGKLLVTWSKR